MDSGKSWRRRLRSPTKLALLVSRRRGAVRCGAAGRRAAAPSRASRRSKPSSTASQSLTADFKQELWTADQKLLQTETGSLSLEAAEPVSLDVRRPDRARGRRGRHASSGSTTSSSLRSRSRRSTTPSARAPRCCSAATATCARNSRSSRRTRADGLDWVKLAPLAGGSDFASVLIGFSGTAPRRLELVDGLGQVTRIELDNLDVNPELADDVFELDVAGWRRRDRRRRLNRCAAAAFPEALVACSVGCSWSSVIVGSLMPGPALVAVAVDVSDKVMHAGAYFVLMVWFAGFYTPHGCIRSIAAVLLALGVGLDLLQRLTETRTFDWHDIAMNWRRRDRRLRVVIVAARRLVSARGATFAKLARC